MGKLYLTVAMLAGLLVSSHAMAASPQVAASQALARDAAKLRKTIELTCTNSLVSRTSYQLESTARLLAEKIERQRCESEVAALVHECIDVYNSLVSYVERDYRLATSPQVVSAMQCTATQLNKTIAALRQYESRPPQPVVPAVPQPTWSTGRVPVPQVPPFQLGHPPVHREHYVPKQHFEPDHAPIQINRQGNYRNHPDSLGYLPHESQQFSGRPGLGGIQTNPNQPPKIGRMILERVLREALR